MDAGLSVASKPTSGPLVVYRGLGLLLRLGLAFWFRILGPKRARTFLVAGLVGSTIAALILEQKL